MKKIGMLLALLVTVIGTNGNAQFFDRGESNSDIQSFSFEEDKEFKIKFFPFNEANVEEFLKGRTLVKAKVDSILSKGFIPRLEKLDVGIVPRKMKVGQIAWEDQKLYVSITTSDDELERALLQFFKIELSYGKISYFLHNFPKMDEFFGSVELVNKIVKKIEDTGFVMKVEELEVGIAPKPMEGGSIVVEDKKLYISVTVDEDKLERILLQFFEWFE